MTFLRRMSCHPAARLLLFLVGMIACVEVFASITWRLGGRWLR